MTSKENKLIEVLMKMDGMKVSKEDLKRWTSKCHFHRDLLTPCGSSPQEHLIYRDGLNGGTLVVKPCEKHLQAYLKLGWRIL